MLQYIGIFAGGLLLLLNTWSLRLWRSAQLQRLETAFPGPTPLPLLGNGLRFVGKAFLQVVTELTQEYGEYVRLYLGTELNLVITNPHDVRLLLMSNKLNCKGTLYKNFVDMIGPGILTGGPTWRNHRKIVTPTYNKRSAQYFGRVFNEEAENLIRDLSLKDPEATFNIFKDIVRTTTQCICQTLMGLTKEESMRLRRLDEVVEITDKMYAHLFAKMTKWWYWWRPLYRLLGAQRRHDKYKDAFIEMAKDIIRMRTDSLKERTLTEKDAMSEEVLGVVDRLILSEELTDEEIVQETFTLFTTSQEASAKILSCVLLFLAHLPNWQEKVYSEIVEVVGEQGTVCHEHLKRLPSLELVYKEALRYQPIAACIQRTVLEDITLERAPVTIPAGTPVVVPIHALHRDPKYWRLPDLVRPERFLPEESASRDPNAFIPFSLGAMDCLGRVFATALIKTLAVRVVSRYELLAEGSLEALEMDVAISAKLKCGYNVRVRRRADPPRARTTARGGREGSLASG